MGASEIVQTGLAFSPAAAGAAIMMILLAVIKHGPRWLDAIRRWRMAELANRRPLIHPLLSGDGSDRPELSPSKLMKKSKRNAKQGL